MSVDGLQNVEAQSIEIKELELIFSWSSVDLLNSHWELETSVCSKLKHSNLWFYILSPMSCHSAAIGCNPSTKDISLTVYLINTLLTVQIRLKYRSVQAHKNPINLSLRKTVNILSYRIPEQSCVCQLWLCPPIFLSQSPWQLWLLFPTVYWPWDLCQEEMCLSYKFLMCCAQSLQSCKALCDPMDCSPPGSSVLRILQARILEWVAVPSSRGSSQPRDWILISCFFSIGRWVLYH